MEALIWHQFDHKNIMPFYGVNLVEFAPQVALISPWMSNGDMFTYIRRRSPPNRMSLVSHIFISLMQII